GDNNIMPHGLTGSFSGGPTGNVILNANVTRQAIFDLNGSTQTINGLSSTSAGLAGTNIVESTAGTATLILGDSNATATFGGIVRDNGGTIALTKIGSGVQTLAGANTYTGATNINAGALS